jgi:hypothetical protein
MDGHHLGYIKKFLKKNHWDFVIIIIFFTLVNFHNLANFFSENVKKEKESDFRGKISPLLK